MVADDVRFIKDISERQSTIAWDTNARTPINVELRLIRSVSRADIRQNSERP
jgi:hypothetical protein